MPSLLLRALAVAAVVAVLIPTCSMAACGMQMDFAALLTCDSVWFASDAETGVLMGVFLIALFLVAAIPMTTRENTEWSTVLAPHDTPEPHPPDDPLVGRLRL
jgi:hypothetical protein